jgi:fucose 4-O-acetylase-like acetyltransferase
MAMRLISAKSVGDDLAAGRIAAREQSLYLIASFLIWLIPAYLFLFPNPRTQDDPHFFWFVWLIELAFLILFCAVGIGYCLGKCRVDPTRHFLVDFSCLNAPISLTTLTLVWGGFYILTEPVFALLGGTFAWLTSSRAYDVVRLFASTGAVFIVFLRIGKHMNRVSLIRESANSTVEADARKSATRPSL